jgi:hypothetical protein
MSPPRQVNEPSTSNANIGLPPKIVSPQIAQISADSNSKDLDVCGNSLRSNCWMSWQSIAKVSVLSRQG